mgnify:CR=1 FL=1
MKKLAVIMDTWTTMYEDNKNGNNIYIVPLMIFAEINGKMVEYREHIDISKKEILDKIEKNIKMSTSQPSIGNSMKKLEQLLNEYEKILIIPIPEILSGTFSMWQSIIKELPEEDSKRIVLKDFMDVSIASYNSVQEALELSKNEEDPINFVIENLNKRMTKWFACFITGDMNRLIKSGRVGFLKGFLASFLKKKITIGWEDGFKKIAASSKIEKNLEISLQFAEKKISYIKKGIKKLYIASVHGFKNNDLDSYTNFIKDYLAKKNVKIGKIIPMDITNSVVIHLGEKTLAFYIETN